MALTPLAMTEEDDDVKWRWTSTLMKVMTSWRCLIGDVLRGSPMVDDGEGTTATMTTVVSGGPRLASLGTKMASSLSAAKARSHLGETSSWSGGSCGRRWLLACCRGCSGERKSRGERDLRRGREDGFCPPPSLKLGQFLLLQRLGFFFLLQAVAAGLR